MSNVLEVDNAKLVEAAAERLKKMGVEKPKYVEYVKSGAGNERVPLSRDFWYFRCASILRQTYINGPIGISKLRTRYGTRKRHAVHRHHMVRAGGSMIKDAFTALEKIGYVKATKEGRVITSKGKSFVDRLAGELLKEKGA